MGIANQSHMEELDSEWVQLIMTAKDLGLSKDDVRTFLEQAVPKVNWNMEISS